MSTNAHSSKPSYDVFLSHNSEDKPAVETIANRLEDEGISPYLDIWHLTPGKLWLRELADALEESACVAVFFGPSGLGAWHHQEMQIALNKAARTQDNFRLIPVLLPGADKSQVDSFLQLRTWVDFSDALVDELAFGRLLSAIKGKPSEQFTSVELPNEPKPYRGLERFEKDHAEFFFGRDGEIRRLIDRLEKQRFVAVVGASGSGKSSLVRAGLYTDTAETHHPGIKEWRRITLVPGNDPIRSIATQLVEHLPASDRPGLVEHYKDNFPKKRDGLITALQTLFPNPQHKILLVVDQFEELYTQQPRSESNQPVDSKAASKVAAFAANLFDAHDANLDWLRIVVTLRADFVDRFVKNNSADFRKLLEQRQFWLGPMDEG